MSDTVGEPLSGYGQSALRSALPLSGEEIRDILAALGLSPTVRGEALSVSDWIRLSNACGERF